MFFAKLRLEQPILQADIAFLRQKICLMSLIEAVFKREAGDRRISFKTIAQEVRLPIDEVLYLRMLQQKWHALISINE